MKVTTDACLFGAWVAKELADKSNAIQNCLDIGTGSGLLSLMIAQKNSLVIDAIEIDEAAAQQASENAKASKWNDRIRIAQEDVLQWEPKTKYNWIVSNPPFYENQLRSGTKKKDVAHHDQGLTLPSLLSFVKQHLTDDGFFFLLIPAIRLDETNALLKRNELFTGQRILVKQTPKHPPFRVLIKAGIKENSKIIESIVIIKNEKDEYTPDFVALLRDYYLYL